MSNIKVFMFDGFQRSFRSILSIWERKTPRSNFHIANITKVWTTKKMWHMYQSLGASNQSPTLSKVDEETSLNFFTLLPKSECCNQKGA